MKMYIDHENQIFCKIHESNYMYILYGYLFSHHFSQWAAELIDQNYIYDWTIYDYSYEVIECFDPNTEEDFGFRVWLTKYLLDLENQNKNPPNSAFLVNVVALKFPLKPKSMEIG